MDSLPNLEDAVLFSEECYKKYADNGKGDDKRKRDCDCHHHKPHDCKQDEIIESIALVEAALAHILNAEGEKLQKGVELACTIKDLLEVNQSVRSTLIHATFLEHTLFAKLETICNGCDICDKHEKHM